MVPTHGYDNDATFVGLKSDKELIGVNSDCCSLVSSLLVSFFVLLFILLYNTIAIVKCCQCTALLWFSFSTIKQSNSQPFYNRVAVLSLGFKSRCNTHSLFNHSLLHSIVHRHLDHCCNVQQIQLSFLTLLTRHCRTVIRWLQLICSKLLCKLNESHTHIVLQCTAQQQQCIVTASQDF